MRRSHRGDLALAIAGLMTIHVDAIAATAWRVVYPERGTNGGFYDPSPRQPIGGNHGTTLGEQRRIAFEKAVSIWADVLSSPVAITLEAKMSAMPCDADGAVLGQASPTTAASLSSDKTLRALTYPIALANAIYGEDLEPATDSNPGGAEIQAEFNSDIDNAVCLDGSVFYLGLDGSAGPAPDFLGVVLHELGHGLGFMSFIDLGTAEPLMPDAPDVFSTQTFDIDRQATWETLSPTELQASFGNARRVVWNGAHVRSGAEHYLVKGSPRMTVTPPIAGLSDLISEHDDGPKVADNPTTAPLVVPSPATGCSRPRNPARLRGAIALVDPQSDCHPLEAVARMQEHGARAVVVVDSTLTWPPAMVVGILDGQTIPAVSIHRDDATLLAANAVGRTVTLDGDMTRFVGTDAQGRVYLNATRPVDAGTTISHWDSLARDQLLMEPERCANYLGVDLTREFMWDLGWGICGDGALQGIEECDDGNIVEGDGCSASCKNDSNLTAAAAVDVDGAAGVAGADEVSCSCRVQQPTRSHVGATGLGWLVLLFVRRRTTRAVHRAKLDVGHARHYGVARS